MGNAVTLKVEHLVKKYHTNSEPILKDVNIEVYEGEIYGFLGRNGVGKSTTIKCITGLHDFDEGSITINGYDILKEPLKAKQSFGFVPDNHIAYLGMSGREYIDFIAGVYGKVDDYQEYFDYLVDYFEIRNAIDKLIGEYSHGMKQKICLIASLIHRPKVWILDEPTVGLDIMITKKLIDKMKEYKSLGNSIFLTSHNIDLVGKLCDRVAVVNGGKIMDVVDLHEKTNMEEVEEIFLKLTEVIK